MTVETLDINPRFRDIIRPLSDEEKNALEISLLKQGLLDSVKFWPDNGKKWIVDGHHRYEIYQKQGPNNVSNFKAEPLNFVDEDEAAEWILNNQLMRRNLNANERTLYVGQLLELRKKRRGGLKKEEEGGNTAAQIATEQNMSERTVTRAAEVARLFPKADKEIQEKFVQNKITQAELVRSLKQKDEKQAIKKDKRQDDVTVGLRTVAERILKNIRGLRSNGDDLDSVFQATGLPANALAPELINLSTKLKKEERQAEVLTTMIKVEDLCPNKASAKKCVECGGARYVTQVQFEALQSHYGLDKVKVEEKIEEVKAEAAK